MYAEKHEDYEDAPQTFRALFRHWLHRLSTFASRLRRP